VEEATHVAGRASTTLHGWPFFACSRDELIPFAARLAHWCRGCGLHLLWLSSSMNYSIATTMS